MPRPIKLIFLAALALALAPSSAHAVSFGANLNRDPVDQFTCQGSFGYPSCTADFNSPQTGETVYPPVGTGRITRVRVKVGATTGPMQMVVLQASRANNTVEPGKPGYNCCKAVALSHVFTPRANDTTPVDMNLPVKNELAPDPVSGMYYGEHLALSVLAPDVPLPTSPEGNAITHFYGPAFRQGDENPGYGTSGHVILFNADWEPAAASAPGPGPAGIQAPGSGPIKLGRLRTRPNGTALLPVDVPGAGTLRVLDPVAAATTAQKKRKRKKRAKALIASTTKKATKAGRVTIRIKPTKAGKRILRRKGRLSRKIVVRFTQTGATTSSNASKRVGLRLVRKRKR